LKPEGGVHHWLKRRSTREERKPVTRNDDDNNDNDDDNNNKNKSSTLFHTATNLRKSLQNDTKQIKTTIARNMKKIWVAKRLHGQFPQSLHEGLIDKEQSYRSLKFGDIKGETESIIMAAHYQEISTNNYNRKF
jgi:hypothetical protein